MMTLAKNKQRAFSREELVNLLWGYESDRDLRIVDTHIKNIRDKTLKAGLSYNPIQTIWGVGYKLNGAGVLNEKE